MLLFSKSFKPISFKFSDTSFKGRFIGLFFSQKTGYEVPLQVEPSAAAAESFFLAFFPKSLEFESAAAFELRECDVVCEVSQKLSKRVSLDPAAVFIR